MKVSEFAQKSGLEVISGRDALDNIIKDGYCCDLLSEVMGKAEPGSLWMTVHGHINIIGVAVLKDLAGIVVTGGHGVDPETIEKAEKENIPLLIFRGTTFNLAGELFRSLHSE